MYDVIVVGARCAGSPTAMLLARRGYRVLLVDKATFPSDTISTHILWPHGAECMDRWGLLTSLAETGVPAICQDITFDVGPFALRGSISNVNQGRGGFCPRRTVLDHLLVNAAATSGVEVRQGFRVESLIFDGDAVAGIRGRDRNGRTVEERSRLVVGADGVHSFVAQAVDAPEYDRRPIAGCAYYSYFSGVDIEDVEMYVRDYCAFGGVPTHDGLTMVMVNWPVREFPAIRQDIENHVARAIARAPGFADRVNGGRREEKWYGSAGVPNYFRRPYGNGWALAGDAGYCRDYITAQGISDAFIDAEAVSGAIDAGLSGQRDLSSALAEVEASRNARVRAMYEFAYDLAQMEPPPPPMLQLFQALHGDRQATSAFFSAMSGATNIGEFMSPDNVGRLVGAARPSAMSSHH